MTPEEEIESLKAALGAAERSLALEREAHGASIEAARQAGGALLARLERYEPKELMEQDVQIVKLVANAVHGARLHELEAGTGLKPERLRFHLGRLQRLGFVLAHGGGDEPLCFKLDKPGREYAAGNDLM